MSIISWDGSPLPGLGPRSFNAAVQHDSLEISSLRLDQEPRRILLLIDTSGSFLDKADLAIGFASDLLDHILPPNEIGLASFAGTLKPIIAPTADRSLIRDRLRTVFPSTRPKSSKFGGTALWDAVRNGADLLGDSRVGDVIFLITDGGENHSKEDSKQTLVALLAKGIRLFAVEIPDPLLIRALTASPREGDPVERMTYVTEETGGFAIFPPAEDLDAAFSGKMPTEVRKSLDLQYHLILNFYRLDVMLKEPPERQLKWKLSLADTKSYVRKNYDLRYPKSFLPCN